MFQFTIFRIPVRVEPFHWVILALLGIPRDLSDRNGLIQMLLFMLAGFFSILVHELGHALTGKKFGVRNPEIVLHGMGGVAIFPGARFTRKESFLTTLAGPGIQIILGLVAYLIYSQIPFQPGISEFLWKLFFISIFWAVLNLFPIMPMDGGQMLHAALGDHRIKITYQVGIITGVLLAITCLVLKVGIFAPILFGYLAYQNYQRLLQIQTPWR